MNTITLSPRQDTVPVIWRNAALLAVLTILSNALFWPHDLGVNVAIAVAAIVAVMLVRAGGAIATEAKTMLMAMVVSSAMVVVHGSALAITLTISWLIAFSGFMLAPGLRNVLSAVGHSLYNLASVPLSFAEGMAQAVPEKGASRKGIGWLKLSLLPMVVLVAYYWIYRAANPKFSAMTEGMMVRLADLIDTLVSGLFTGHALFLLLSALVGGALLLKLAPGTIGAAEAKLTDAMVRLRLKRPHWKTPLPMNALERERRIGVLLLVLVNALLLLVNIIDIDWVWFGFRVEEGFSLKQFVHQGTWLLIVSILLSMAILLRLFRRNLNFHPRAVWLKRLALLWLAQNAVLAVSVFLRNMHYIGFHGLAYKRIGVIVFLVLVLAGLVALAWKIHARRSTFFLWRVNAWAAVAVLTALSCFDWDKAIVKYNLAHPNPAEIDTDNYLALSDKVLPLLHQHRADVQRQMAKHATNHVRWTDTQDPLVFNELLDRKTRAFLTRWQGSGWQSWTLAEQRTYDELVDLVTPKKP